MQSKKIAAAGLSTAALGLVFGASVAQAATLNPSVDQPAVIEKMMVADTNNNNNNNNNKQLMAAAKPSSLGAIASALA